MDNFCSCNHITEGFKRAEFIQNAFPWDYTWINPDSSSSLKHVFILVVQMSCFSVDASGLSDPRVHWSEEVHP